MSQSKKTRNGRAGRRAAPMTPAMRRFLAGCAAEAYLLLIRRFYTQNGIAVQLIAWDGYLLYLGAAGLLALAAGGAWFYALRRRNASVLPAAWLMAGGGFTAAASFLARMAPAAVDLLGVLVPALMLAGVCWELYERTCALSLSVLGVTLVAAWACTHAAQPFSPYLLPARVLGLLWIVLLAALAFAVWSGRFPRLVPAKADPLPVYVGCALSAAAMAASLISAAAAGYVMWILALVLFGLVVYYTVKQL